MIRAAHAPPVQPAADAAAAHGTEPQLGEFLHPVPLAALLVLVLNDHWLKGSGLLPAVITGKPSDFAGLLYFPLFLTAALRAVAHRVAPLLPAGGATACRLQLTPMLVLASCVATGAGFAALKLCPAFTQAYLETMKSLGQRSAVVLDATDLWALSSLPVAYWVGARAARHGRRPT